LKSWVGEIPKRWANIPIPPRSCATNAKTAAEESACFHFHAFPFTALSSFSCSIALSSLLVVAACPAGAQTHARRAKKPSAKSSSNPKPNSVTGSAKKEVSASPAELAGEKQLAQLARTLRDHPNATSYAVLSAYATKNAKNELGADAALALGYYDLMRDKPDLALGWLRKAVDDKDLREYVQYWQAQVSLNLGQREEGLEQLQSFRRDFPDSVMTEQAVTSLAQTALALGKNENALAALNGYPNTAAKSAMLLLRAEAREKLAAVNGEKPLSAASDYLDLYYRFPLSEEARAAGQKIAPLQAALGDQFPGTPVQAQMARAESYYVAKRWHDARSEYVGLLPKLAGIDRERADLRIAQCDTQTGAGPELLAAVPLSDPELDAERLFTLSQAFRSQILEPQMLDEVDQLVKRHPQSPWVEDALFATGNYYWVNLDRDRAAEYYRRTVDAFPDGKNSQQASWRVAWTAYLERKPEAADMLEAYVRRFPTSSYVQDTLYWLGRSYERSGNMALARSFYHSGAARFPLTYFGAKSAARLSPLPEGIGPEPVTPAEFLSVIPPAPPLPPVDQPLTEKAKEHETRAHALSNIAFDASAELEYRAAYAAERVPRLLINAAQAAIAAGHYGVGISTMRQTFPQLEARRLPDIPTDVWRTAFPLPYESSLRGAAAGNHIDPMFMAGLIRQESAFESNAISHQGAMGLMQVMPGTASKLARQLRVRYTRANLTDPGYNLKLGARYLADLLQIFGTHEAVLAAYNAGEDRVVQWTAGQDYLETAEFVESIPFTETREYVQIVIRNADVYRQVYDAGKLDQTRLTLPEGNRSEEDEVTRPAKVEVRP
jgi:soluble lytic murein transglycosylase